MIIFRICFFLLLITLVCQRTSHPLTPCVLFALFIHSRCSLSHSQDGKTPLFRACEDGHAGIITELLKAGANSAATYKDKDILSAAISGKNGVDALSALLEGKVVVDRNVFEGHLKGLPTEKADKLRAAYTEKLEARAKAVSKELKDVVPIPASAYHKAPIDVLSAYTGFSVKLDSDAGKKGGMSDDE
mgnify:CR=1 FL=1